MSETQNTTKLITRIINKHDLEVNWLKAVNFVPFCGETIIYDAEVDTDGRPLTLPEGRTAPYTYARTKIGDGVTLVGNLPFIADPANITAGLGLKTTQTSTRVSIDIDDDITFIFDAGNAADFISNNRSEKAYLAQDSVFRNNAAECDDPIPGITYYFVLDGEEIGSAVCEFYDDEYHLEVNTDDNLFWYTQGHIEEANGIDGSVISIYYYKNYACPSCGTMHATQELANACECSVPKYTCPNCGEEYDNEYDANSCCPTYYYCPKCGSEYDNEADAESCCDTIKYMFDEDSETWVPSNTDDPVYEMACPHCYGTLQTNSDFGGNTFDTDCPHCGEPILLGDGSVVKPDDSVTLYSDGSFTFNSYRWNGGEYTWTLWTGTGEMVAEAETSSETYELGAYMDLGAEYYVEVHFCPNDSDEWIMLTSNTITYTEESPN